MFKNFGVLFIILIIFSCENNIISENEEYLEITLSIANKEIVSENSGIIITFVDSLNIFSLEADSIYESLTMFDDTIELKIKKIESSKKILLNGKEQNIWYDEENKTAAIIKETNECYQDGIDSTFQLNTNNRLHIESMIMDIYDNHLSNDINMDFILDTANASISPNVFPNPYFGTSSMESIVFGERKIFFSHLPDTCSILIYNSQGEFINSILHTSPYTESIMQWDVKNYLGKYVLPGIYHYEVYSSKRNYLHGVFIIACKEIS
jgi:hypothetical protein